MKPELYLERALSRLMRASGRRPWVVVAIVAFLTLGSLAVLVTVEPEVDTDIQAGYFGTHDAQANAFRELRSKVAGVNSEIVYFELKPDARAPNGTMVTNVTDIAALLAQQELFDFVKAEFAARTGDDKVISDTSLPYFYKLIYKQFPQGGFQVPTNPVDHRIVGQLVLSAGGPSIDLYHSYNESKPKESRWDAAVMFIIYNPDTAHLSKKATGGLINEIVQDYREMGVSPAGTHCNTASGSCKTYDLWEPKYLDSWGVQSWIYRIDQQVQKEAVVFTAAVFAFLTLVLVYLVRSVKRALIGIGTLAIILIIVLAGMTLGHVPIGFISMAMFPLILGVGVDYVIHIMNEFGSERSKAADADEAFGHIGRRGAVALLIATLTTLAGFLIMIASTSPMIVQICLASFLGIGGIYLLSVTFVPALLVLTMKDEAKEVFHPSDFIANVAAWIGRHKVVAVAALLVTTAVLGAYVPKVEYVIGTVEVNLPQRALWTGKEDRAHMLDMYERFQDHIKASGQETVITTGTGPGTLATRAAVQDMISIHRNLVAEPFVQASAGAVNSVPFILNLYAILKDGIQSAGPAVGNDAIQGGALVPCPVTGPATSPLPPAIGGVIANNTATLCYPGLDSAYDPTFAHIKDWDDAQVQAAYADMLQRPEWKPLLLTFMDKDASIAWALTFVNIHIDQQATQKADHALHAVLEKSPATATHSQYFGTLTGIKKYNDYTNKWLTISSVASFSMVVLLVGIFLRSWRAVIAVSLPMLLTFVWWVGMLPIIHIQIAFVFLIPVAFITSMGSDYAVHLTYNLHHNPNPRDVFRTVGKGVAYSSLTTFTSFLIFSRGAIRGSYEMFVAAVLAVIIITAATFLAVPLFYFRRDRSWQPKGARDDGHAKP